MLKHDEDSSLAHLTNEFKSDSLSPLHSSLTIDDSIECLPFTEDRFQELYRADDEGGTYDYDDGAGDSYSKDATYIEVSSDGYKNFPKSIASAVAKLCPPTPVNCAADTERLRKVFCCGLVYGPPHVALCVGMPLLSARVCPFELALTRERWTAD